MMQAPAYQQEHQGSQDQVGQQMMLCPVRLVYETQMLVQPGEQIHPNQTILINPQNTPPWIQNRQVQNQVIYVQHVPTNYIPQPQQHIDQNQLYIQNFGYQNVPQMYVQNPQEQIRPLQVVPNIVPNMPTNIGGIQNPRMMANVASIPQSVNVVNIVPNQNNTHRLVAPNQINPTELVNKPQETNMPIYRHQLPQMVQQEPRFPIQPTITMVPNNVQTMPIVPPGLDPNINQIRPLQQNITTSVQQTYPNTIFNSDESKKVSSPVNKGNNNLNVVNPLSTAKNAAQTYRPIQPRTNRNNAPNLIPVQLSSTQTQQIMPNMITMNNVPRKILTNNTIPVPNTTNPNTTNSAPVGVRVEGNNSVFNRKRKSESPDEMHKKVTITNRSDTPQSASGYRWLVDRSDSYNNSTDVGVNTSPVHRPSGRITINNLQITPLNPNVRNSKLIEELAKPVRQYPAVIEPSGGTTNTVTSVPPVTETETLPTDKDKLVRNTVYVQARGRILADKDIIPETSKVETTIPANPETNLNLPLIPEKLPATINQEQNIETNEVKQASTNTINPSNIEDTKSKTSNESTKDTLKNQDKQVDKEVDKEVDKIKTDVKINQEPTASKSKLETPASSDSIQESSPASKQKKKSTASSKLKAGPSDDAKIKETKEEPAKAKVKEDRAYILTHVLGGFVIQESNVAFPIRRPLKEKTLLCNNEEFKRDNPELRNDRELVKDNSKILDISHLNLKECDNIEATTEETVTPEMDDKDNPFTKLKPSDIKSWTAEELATHLVKYNWNETVSLLQEHELDGESLMLVSKAQLITIGVKEEHAEIICEFVKG